MTKRTPPTKPPMYKQKEVHKRNCLGRVSRVAGRRGCGGLDQFLFARNHILYSDAALNYKAYGLEVLFPLENI